MSDFQPSTYKLIFYAGTEVPAPLDATRKRLKRQAAIASQDEEAVRAPESSIERVIAFLSHVPEVLGTVKTAVGMDGSIGLLWRSEAATLYLDFLTDGRVRTFVRLGNVDTKSVLSDPTDEQLLDLARRALENFRGVQLTYSLSKFAAAKDLTVAKEPAVVIASASVSASRYYEGVRVGDKSERLPA